MTQHAEISQLVTCMSKNENSVIQQGSSRTAAVASDADLGTTQEVMCSGPDDVLTECYMQQSNMTAVHIYMSATSHGGGSTGVGSWEAARQ